LRGLFVLAC